MTNALRAEIRKLTTTQVLVWLLVLTGGLSLLIAGLTAGLTPRDDPGSPLEDVLNGTASVALLVSSVLGVIGITGEYRHLTVTPTFLSVPRRGTVIVAKMITYLVTGLALGLLAVVVSLAVAAPWLSGRGFDVDLGSDSVLRIALGGIVASGIWGIIGVGFGALLRSQIAAVVGLLIYRFLVEGILSAIPKVQDAYPYLPGGATTSVLAPNDLDADTLGFDLLSPWAGGALLLAYGVVFALLASRLTVRRDVS